MTCIIKRDMLEHTLQYASPRNGVILSPFSGAMCPDQRRSVFLCGGLPKETIARVYILTNTIGG